MEFVSHVKFRQLQTQRYAYQNNTFSFATRLGWLATEFTSHFHKLYIKFPLLRPNFISFILLREYDTVARADNYFAEYRMLFLRRHSNERNIFRGSCIDVIKSRLRQNLKAPVSSRIMSFFKNKQTNNTKLRQNMWCSFAEQLCFISVKVIIGTRVMCIF